MLTNVGYVIETEDYNRLISYLRDKMMPGPYKSDGQELWEIYHNIKEAPTAEDFFNDSYESFS